MAKGGKSTLLRVDLGGVQAPLGAGGAHRSHGEHLQGVPELLWWILGPTISLPVVKTLGHSPWLWILVLQVTLEANPGAGTSPHPHRTAS